MDFNATTALDDFRLVVLCLWCNHTKATISVRSSLTKAINAEPEMRRTVKGGGKLRNNQQSIVREVWTIAEAH